ncbi:hypothetical protein Tco_0811564, partial [Tanacetum coccineum]
VLGWKTQVLYLPICGSLEEHCQKNSRKKSTGYVKKYDQSSSSGLIYDGSEVMMVMSTEALLDWIIDSGVAGELNVSDEEKDSLAQVWYKRLGHISEVGLLVLEKHELFGKKSLRKVTPSQFWGRKTHYSGRGYGFIFSGSNTKHLESSKSGSREEEDTHESLTYPEVVACEDISKWKAVMKEEMDSLRKNKT